MNKVSVYLDLQIILNNLAITNIFLIYFVFLNFYAIYFTFSIYFSLLHFIKFEFLGNQLLGKNLYIFLLLILI